MAKEELFRGLHEFRTNHVEIDFEENIIFNIDGEKLTNNHFVIDVMPKAITVFNDDKFVQSVINIEKRNLTLHKKGSIIKM